MESPDWLQFMAEPFEGVMSASNPVSHLASTPPPEKQVSAKTVVHLPTTAPPTPSIPSPPDSVTGSPTGESEDPTVVSVSTTFYPGANLHHSPPDVVVLSSDTVFFYVHSGILSRESSNRLNSLLPSPEESTPQGKDSVGSVIPVPEHSTVINVVLHAMYGMSCQHYSPSNTTLFAGVDALAKYGANLQKLVAPDTPLFKHLLGQSPISPVEFYATAGRHELWDLAVAISPHMLSFPLSDLDDTMVERMGSVYLKRLFFLHLGRVDALKRLLLPPPESHPATQECDFMEQKKLTRAWALASAYLAWDARPDVSTTAIELALRPLGDHLGCRICKSALQERIKQLVVQWALVKRTI